MIRPNKIKGGTSLTTGPVRRKLKRNCIDENALNSPFFRPKKLGRVAKTSTGVLDLARLIPIQEADLAIHRTKLEELKKWLRSTMVINRGPKTLLLTGPSGSGKTSALRVLCAEFGIEINEFDCTEEFDGEAAPFFNGGPSRSKRNSESQLDGFVQFLRSNEFSSIQNMSLKHRLLLIAQLPNALYRDPSKLHSILANLMPSSRCLIAFVLANVDTCWDFSPFRLFPSSVVEQLKIAHIKFKQIADSLLTSALKRVFRLVDLKWDAEMGKQIVSCANGDIRRALNTLSFSLIKIDNRKKIGVENVRHPHQLSEGKPLELFYFIAKILYAKRVDEKNGVKINEVKQWKRTEQKLSRKMREKCGRPLPPKDDLHRLIAAAPISGQCLLGFVHEHEPHFAPSLSSLAKINSKIAFLDVMSRQFGVESDRVADKYMMEIVVRASLFHNYRPAIDTQEKNRWTFYHLGKPRFYEIYAQRNDHRQRMTQAVGIERTAQMETLILPLLSQIRARVTADAEQHRTLGALGSTFNGTHLTNVDAAAANYDNDDGQNYEIDESEDGVEVKGVDHALNLDVSHVFKDEK